MTTTAARGATVVALASLLLGWGATSASADKWSADDASGDVTKYSYTPDPPPCGTLTQAVEPGDATTDIVSFTARHRRTTVELSAQFRDLTGSAQPSVSFDVETDGQAFEISIRRARTGGPVRARVMTAPVEPLPVDECGNYSYLSVGWRCPGVTATMSSVQDLVSVVVSRECLHNPSWIRVGVDAIRVLGDTARRDVWTPNGSDTTAISGPFGPKLRRG